MTKCQKCLSHEECGVMGHISKIGHLLLQEHNSVSEQIVCKFFLIKYIENMCVTLIYF